MNKKMQSRRHFLKGLGIGGFALTGCMSRSAEAQSKADRPNIIYIMADDLGYGDLSCYGQQKFQTPHIDRLASEGMKFTQHYSGSTVCAPSRCSLMTGLHTGHCQIRGNQEVKPEGQVPINRSTVTISTLLKQSGYRTGMFGKWGLGFPGSSGDPANFFDTFYGYNCQREAHSYYPDHLWHNRERIELDGKTYSHDLILDAAKEFISENTNRPFFCYLPVTIPHAAMHAPKDLHDKYRKLFPEFEASVGKYSGPEVTNPVAAFAAMVEHLDNGVGEIMALLKKLDIDENTVVMFTSDNGPHSEGGHKPDFFDSNGPLRGHKRDLYEGGIRVPMIARWPAKIRPASTTDHISAFWDVLPTVCEITNTKTPDEVDGISFVSAMLGEKQKRHEYLYWEFKERGGKQAVRMGRWKGVRLKTIQNPNGPIELYDLDKDLAEKNDIAAEHPAIVEKIDKAMKTASVAQDR